MSSYLSRHNSSSNSRGRHSSKERQSHTDRSNKHSDVIDSHRSSRNELNPESYQHKRENSLFTKTAKNGFGNHGSVLERTKAVRNFGHTQRGFNRFQRGNKHSNDYVKPLSTYRSRQESDKPVARLFDPTAVPKARRYFEHDSRDRITVDNDNYLRRPAVRYAIKRAVERNMYDPRIDRGSLDSRKRYAPAGWRNHPFESKRAWGKNDSFADDDLDSSRNQADRDGIWKHDKFEELEHEENLK